MDKFWKILKPERRSGYYSGVGLSNFFYHRRYFYVVYPGSASASGIRLWNADSGCGSRRPKSCGFMRMRIRNTIGNILQWLFFLDGWEIEKFRETEMFWPIPPPPTHLGTFSSTYLTACPPPPHPQVNRIHLRSLFLFTVISHATNKRVTNLYAESGLGPCKND